MRQPSSDVHAVGFLRHWPDEEGWLARRVEQGTYRAGARLVSEQFAGVVFASEGPELAPYPGGDAVLAAGSLSTLTATSADVCEGPSADQFPCNVGLLQPVLRVISRGKPADCIVFAIVRLAPGRGRQWKEVVTRTAEVEGTWSAAALLHGVAAGNGLVEVVGDSFDACHDRMLELVDHESVSSYDVLHTTGDLTVGFGAEPRG